MRHLLDTKIGDYQAMVPMVDIDTIGAGGGSIAHVDPGGVFRVGPQVGRRRPGPCLLRVRRHRADGHGRPALLGRLRLDRGLLGGGMKLDRALAEQAMQTVATQLGMLHAALGALQVQKYGMTQAIELNSVRRGYDPREFTLVAAGGGGPMFAATSRSSSTSRACSCLRTRASSPRPACSRPTCSTSSSRPRGIAEDPRPIATPGLLRRARQQAVDQLEADGVPEDRRLVRRLADCRYAGQGYEVRTEVPPDVTDGWVEELKERSTRDAEYGHRFDAPIEIINIRAVAIGRVDELQPHSWRPGDGDPSRAKTLGEVVFDVDGKAERHATPFYEGAPRAGDRIAGPAIVEQYDTTTVIPPAWRPRSTPREHRHRLHGRQRAETARGRARDPILMRVIGGAFAAIAKEMAGVLYRMSYSSIIRESEDLGAGIFDRRQRAGRVGLDSDVHGRDAEDRQERHRDPRRGHPRRRRDPPQRPYGGATPRTSRS